MINKYQDDLEEFGVSTFEMEKPPTGSKGGRPRIIYKLNEQQAALLLTWLDNTETVRTFKKNLVRSFYEVKKELADFKVQRAIGKPQRKELTDCIQNWKHKNEYSYKHITDLLFKSTTGLNAKQIKENTSHTTAFDALNTEQLKEYQFKEQQVITLLELDFEYSQIKQLMLND